MAETYTIDELLALPDEALNALAAGLRGWTISKAQPWDDGRRIIQCDVYNESDGAVMPVDDWTPATSRDQSGELLRHAQRLGVRFAVHFWDGAEEITGAVPRILLNRRDVFAVSGNDARAETVAFCAAMLAIRETK